MELESVMDFECKNRIVWEITNDYIIGRTNDISLKNKRIAAFDLDDTIIKPSSDKKFSENENDWKLYDNSIFGKLLKLSLDGYQIVIVSNQKGISIGKVNIDMFKMKLEKIVNYLDLDITFFCSLNDNHYRKPRIGLWSLIDGDKSESFYCGDAGGLKERTINGNYIFKDFSDTDIKFAKNVGIKFIHRDEFVFNVIYDDIKVNYSVDFTKIGLNITKFIPKHQEMILNVGFPASGKSHYSITQITPHDYEYINQDTLKTSKKCIDMSNKYLSENKSVVIDNTNLTKENRKAFIDLAKKYKIKVRCLIFTTPIDVCIHNSYLRNFMSNGNVNVIPKMVYNIMKKKYMKPELGEGFDEIREIEFALDDKKITRNMYEQYYY